MYMLLPASADSDFVAFLVIFIFATLLGFASHAPGGLGVFDAAMLVALAAIPERGAARVAAAVPADLLHHAVHAGLDARRPRGNCGIRSPPAPRRTSPRRNTRVAAQRVKGKGREVATALDARR